MTKIETIRSAEYAAYRHGAPLRVHVQDGETFALLSDEYHAAKRVGSRSHIMPEFILDMP
jgi:hypothetical protein